MLYATKKELKGPRKIPLLIADLAWSILEQESADATDLKVAGVFSRMSVILCEQTQLSHPSDLPDRCHCSYREAGDIAAVREGEREKSSAPQLP